MRGGGVGKKYTKHLGAGFQKLKGKKSKIIIAPFLINYERSLKASKSVAFFSGKKLFSFDVAVWPG